MRAIVLLAHLLSYCPCLIQVWRTFRFRQATQPDQVVITAPLPGQALQGDIIITGNTSVDGFLCLRDLLWLHGDPTGTWFLIQSSTLPVENGLLAHWDTTTITDGDYTLRLVLYHERWLPDHPDRPRAARAQLYPGGNRHPHPAAAQCHPRPGTSLPPSATPPSPPSPPPPRCHPRPPPCPPTRPSSARGCAHHRRRRALASALVCWLLLGAYLGIRQWLRNRK